MEVMGFGIGFLAIFIVLAVVCICIPIAMGAYVYKDAANRGMNPVLWTAATILVPGFIGFVAYLILRNENAANICPKCGKKVSDEFLVCPECAYPLNQSCPKCMHPLAYDWNICPNCANPVPENMKLQKPVKQKKDKGLKALFVLLISVPVLILILFVVLGFFLFSNTTADIVYSETVSVVSEEFEAIDTYSYSGKSNVAFFDVDNCRC